MSSIWPSASSSATPSSRSSTRSLTKSSRLISAIFGKPSFNEVGTFHIGTAPIEPGVLITAVVNFLIVAAALYFCIVMPMNRLAERRKSGQADPEEAPSDEVLLLTEIRDALTNDGQGRLRQ